jgi:hypothetical protein
MAAVVTTTAARRTRDEWIIFMGMSFIGDFCRGGLPKETVY